MTRAPEASVWWQKENLAPGLVLLLVTALAWSYTLRAASMDGMEMPGMPGMTRAPNGLALFLLGWSVMMVAMMLPSALPLVLLYRAAARKERSADRMGSLLAGYVMVWTIAGLPVHLYDRLVGSGGPELAVLPGLLLVGGGAYQFTGLKKRCHARCSSPLFFLAREWRPGVTGAARLGVLHGLDCLGCCLGLMLGLVGLGMMNVAWMLSASVVIFLEKTLPGGHRAASALGVALLVGGVFVLGASLA